MRFIKFMFLFVFFVLGLLFFIQNAQPLSTPLTLKLNLFYSADAKAVEGEKTSAELANEKPTWQARSVPFYFVVVAAFGIGMIFSGIFFFLSQTRLICSVVGRGRRIKILDAEVKRLQAAQEKQKADAAKMIETTSAPAGNP